MVSVLLLLAALSPDQVVVRRADGATTGTVALDAGALLQGVNVETSAVGSAELAFEGGGLRLSASTEVLLEPQGFRLLDGRVAIWATRGVELHLGAERVKVRPGSLVIAELGRRQDGLLVVVRGGAQVESLMVRSGQLWRLGAAEAKVGGAALAELVQDEARDRGESLEVQRFFMEQLGSLRLGAAKGRPALRLTSDVVGSAHGPAGLLLEDALRPPPFFAEEVPPKGPNVRVEVIFRED